MPRHDEPQPPARTQPQRLEALRRANEIRLARAQLKRELAAEQVTIEAVLADPPQAARSAKVADLLRQLPRLGPRRVAHLLTQSQISEAKTVAGLSPRQRAELIRLFRARREATSAPSPRPSRDAHEAFREPGTTPRRSPRRC